MNMWQFMSFFILIIVLFQNCSSNHKTGKDYCQNSIDIKVVNAQENRGVDDFQIYETTNYPEGIIVEIGSVANKYRFKDSAGNVCIPILPDSTLQYRKFVFVKNNYVYTEYFLANAPIDTVLKAIPLN